jgi:Ca-activated chloride channel family protein
MGGWKMVAARRAVGRMIDSLLEQDRFTVLAFDDAQEFPRHADRRLIQSTNRARWQALEWLGQIEARGGTEMGPALCEAARLLAADDSSRQRVLVLVTDGQVAGEDAVLKALAKAAGGRLPRVHTLGIDQAVNAGFLRRLADQGRGTCELVESEPQLDAAMDRIHRTIGQPVLTELRLEPLDGAWVADTLVPSRLPDLFADRPVTVFGRLTAGTAPLRIRVLAVDAAGKPWQQEVSARPAATGTLKSLWGRARVRELEDFYASGLIDDRGRLAKEIVEVSLAAGVLSRFTAYVAVDRSEVVQPGGKLLEVVQPVEMPQGWDMAPPRAMAAGAPPAYSLRRVASGPPSPAYLLPPDPPSGCSLDSLLMGSMCSDAEDPGDTMAAAPPDRERARELARTAVHDCLKPLAGKRMTAGRKRLERLIEALEALLDVYAGAADEQAVREALDQARSLLQALDRGDRAALSYDNRLALVRQTAQVLDRLSPSSGEPREDFWR